MKILVAVTPPHFVLLFFFIFFLFSLDGDDYDDDAGAKAAARSVCSELMRLNRRQGI